MHEIIQKHPLEILQSFEQRAHECSVSIPEKIDKRKVWSGISFQIASEHLTLQADEVVELINCPKVARVPGTQPWVKGLANIRGRILTVVDLACFFTGKKTAVKPRSRIIAIRDDVMQTAFLVDDVIGLKHFFEDDYQDSHESFSEWIGPFLQGCYKEQERYWGVMNLQAVLNSPEFMQAGALVS